MVILGISAFYHDSAVALVKDGEIVFAAQEERFSRKKHDHAFPDKALNSALDYCGLTNADIDCVVFYEKPFLKFERLMSTYVHYAPRGLSAFLHAVPVWFKEKLFIKNIIEERTGSKEVLFVKHHEAHAAAAFFPSPFNDAAILTVDGVGEWETFTLGKGSGNELEMLKSIRFPHSLGLLYSAFTYYTGFRVNSGEYKVMGLAPYGEAKYVKLIFDNLVDVKEDGSFRLNLKYFNYHLGLTMTNGAFDSLFKAPPRRPESPIRQLDMDLAASIQAVLEDILEKGVRHAKKVCGGDNLVLAGGVALNCVANGKIQKKQIFKNIWIQPASGDAGGALGAALFIWFKHLKQFRQTDEKHDSQKGSFLGPSFKEEAIKTFLDKKKAKYIRLSQEEIPSKAAALLNSEKVIGLYQGRMEYGPRALGHRSIIGDARSREMQRIMNVKIKFRESFRPFAPSVLEDEVGNYFDFQHRSPYMLMVADVLESRRYDVSEAYQRKKGLEKLDTHRSVVPAVTHVDFSARIHTVNKKVNPLFHEILMHFYVLTGCPMIVNTSFNVRGEPIVCSPEDAYTVFENTDIDALFLEGFFIEKTENAQKKMDDEWIKQFPPD